MTDIHYTVRGSWPFPRDMLRRDQSEAATPEDQALIDNLSLDHAPDRASISMAVTINLVIRDAGRAQPMTARWESFGWSVPSDLEFAERDAETRRLRQFPELLKVALSKLTPEEIEALEWHGLVRPS